MRPSTVLLLLALGAADAARAGTRRRTQEIDDVADEELVVVEDKKQNVKIKDSTGYLTFTTSCMNVNFDIWYGGDGDLEFMGGGAPNANCYPFENSEGYEAWRCHPQKDINYDFKTKDNQIGWPLFGSGGNYTADYAFDAAECGSLVYYRLSCSDHTENGELDLSYGGWSIPTCVPTSGG